MSCSSPACAFRLQAQHALHSCVSKTPVAAAPHWLSSGACSSEQRCLMPLWLAVMQPMQRRCAQHRVRRAQDEEAVQRLAERMRGLLEPFMLRRLKAEVAGQLAPKTQKVVQVSQHGAPVVCLSSLSSSAQPRHSLCC